MSADQTTYEARCDWLDERTKVNDDIDYQLFEEVIHQYVNNGRTETEARSLALGELF